MKELQDVVKKQELVLSMYNKSGEQWHVSSVLIVYLSSAERQ